MEKQSFTKAIGYASNGLYCFFRWERNGKIQLCFSILTILLALYFHISSNEWIAIIGCIGLVIALEMMNTAIELLCNLIEPNYNSQIKTIKDIAAAAVFFSSIASIVIGCLIFLPKFNYYIYEI